VAVALALVIAIAAVVHFAAGVRLRLSTGMTGFDSTWYHGPFAAGFFQSGDTWDLHFITPQFLAWFYPANSEIFHAVGMLAFGRDILSPLLNLGWFVGCLVAAWCIGRPFGVAPISLALGAIALSVPALADQAGEARNDIVGIFFLLAAVAIALNAQSSDGTSQDRSRVRTFARIPGSANAPPGTTTGALIVVGLTAGLAAGTKLNFLLPAAVLVVGLTLIAPRGARLRALTAAGLAAVASGGYWYLRNLIHTGNPLPWVHHLGPISLPAPEQALGGREGHSVFGYLTDGSVWSDWLLPGLHHGLGLFWPLLGGLALAGLLLCLASARAPHRSSTGASDRDTLLAVIGLAGLAAVFAWLIAPTSASGPDGMPHGFESGLRYLAPALVLGLALLPVAPPPRDRLRRWASKTAAGKGDEAEEASQVEGVGSGIESAPFGSTSSGRSWFHRHGADCSSRPRHPLSPRMGIVAGALALIIAVAIGYPVQRHYFENRYADPSFTTPGLDAAFKWARSISGARIATTSTRQYPLFGTDLSNRVDYIGAERPHGGFVPPATCPTWRHLLNAGHYDYVVATRDRIEPGKRPYPPTARWTAGRNVRVVLRRPPTVVYQLRGSLGPSACR